MNKEYTYDKISELVNRFEEHKESYTTTDYNETKTRRDFIDPFFKALGWDIDNEQGLAEAYREVIHEDKVKINNNWKNFKMQFSINKTLLDRISILPFNNEVLTKIIVDSPFTPMIYKIAGLLRTTEEQNLANDLGVHY